MRAGLNRGEMSVLAAAGALESLEGHRHLARWAVAGIEQPLPLYPGTDGNEAIPMLRRPSEGQDIVADYRSLGLTLGRHPLALLRSRFLQQRYVRASDLRELRNGAQVRVAGLVITKQRPGTASGVTFVTLEDETGCINLVVWKTLADTQRKVLLGARLMGVEGELQIEDNVIHVISRKMIDHSGLLGHLLVKSRDFR